MRSSENSISDPRKSGSKGGGGSTFKILSDVQPVPLVYKRERDPSVFGSVSRTDGTPGSRGPKQIIVLEEVTVTNSQTGLGLKRLSVLE